MRASRAYIYEGVLAVMLLGAMRNALYAEVYEITARDLCLVIVGIGTELSKL